MTRHLILCLCLFLAGVLMQRNNKEVNVKDIVFQQNDYHIKPEHVEVVRYNKEYIKHASIVTFKHNRTCTAVNVTGIANVDLGNDVMVVGQAYKFMSNEYRLFPMRGQINACDALSKNILGVGAHTKCGNFTGCPIFKDVTYFVCKLTADESKAPPFIPTGRYMLELQAFHFNVELGLIRGYLEISRPIG